MDASFLSPWNGFYEVGIRQLDPDQCALRSNNPPVKLVTGGRSPRTRKVTKDRVRAATRHDAALPLAVTSRDIGIGTSVGGSVGDL